VAVAANADVGKSGEVDRHAGLFQKGGVAMGGRRAEGGFSGHLQRRDILEIQLVRWLLLPPATGKFGLVGLLLPREAKSSTPFTGGSQVMGA
jgi:hypothetical protein